MKKRLTTLSEVRGSAAKKKPRPDAAEQVLFAVGTDIAARRVAGASESSTFVVTPELLHDVPTTRFPQRSLSEALGRRLKNPEWRAQAWGVKELSDDESGVEELSDDKSPYELIYVADGNSSVVYPHNSAPVAVDRDELDTEKSMRRQGEMAESANAEEALQTYENVMQHGFVQSIVQAWCHHFPIILKPDHIWLLILQGISKHVSSNATELRRRLLSRKSCNTTEKIDLTVIEDQNLVLQPESTGHGDEIERLVGTLNGLMTKHLSLMAQGASSVEYSTTTNSDRMTFKLTMMDMCRSYFNYWFRGHCGFPSVSLAGSLEDWESLRARAEEVIEALCLPQFSKHWCEALLPTLDRFIAAYRGDIDQVFWNAMVKRCGVYDSYWATCGYTGWFHVFLPVDTEGNFSEWCVPYGTSVDYVQDGLRECWDAEDGVSWRDCFGFPSGISQVPIQVRGCGSMPYLLHVHGGFVGYSQDSETGALMPVTSWYVLRELGENDGLPPGFASYVDEQGQTRYRSEVIRVDQSQHPSAVPALVPGNYAGVPAPEDHVFPRYWSPDDGEELRFAWIDRSDSQWKMLSQCVPVGHPEWLGTGSDYHRNNNGGWQYNALKLAAAWRIENRAVWRKYREERAMVGCTCRARSFAGAPFGILPRDAKFELHDDLQLDVGETLLLHGTRSEHLLSIIKHGFNERVAKRGYFGYGTYFADDAGKADQYVDHIGDPGFDSNSSLHNELYYKLNQWHPRHVHYILLCRVALGHHARSHDGEINLDTGGPVWLTTGKREQRRELANIPGVEPPCRHHSLIMEPGGPPAKRGVARYREFIVTHSDQVYPEYLLAIHRDIVV